MRRLFDADVIVGGLTALLFLFVFAQAGNLNHGGTPGMSRYALWLVPLLVPILRDLPACDAPAGDATSARRILGTLALMSAAWSMFVFHPRQPEDSGRPTRLAAWLWTRHPPLDNPLPEIFVERLAGYESDWLPIATAGCEKVLLIGRGDRPDGLWPRPCYPAPVPDACRVAAALCYANRRGMSYEFVEVREPGGRTAARYGGDVWTPESERPIRRFLERARWWTWREATPAEAATVRAAYGVDRVAMLAGDGVIVLRVVKPGDNASLTLRLPAAMRGFVMDSQQPESPAEFDGPAGGERWDLAVPRSGGDVLYLFEPSGSEPAL